MAEHDRAAPPPAPDAPAGAPQPGHGRLILEPRRRSLRHGLESVVTLLLWLAMAYLTFAYVTGAPAALAQEQGWGSRLAGFAYSIGLVGLTYAAVLAAYTLCMALWAVVNKLLARRQPARPVDQLEERRLMRAFEVSRSMFERLMQTNVVTIFHDEHGDIESIRPGDQVPEEGAWLSQLPPDSFVPTAWNSAWLDEDDWTAAPMARPGGHVQRS